MRSIGRHVERFREANRCVKFLTPHRRVIKSFQVNHKDLREPVNCKVFLNIHLALAARTFKPGLNHSFRLDKFVKALLKFNRTEETYGFAWNLNT